jgi:hypothetical protein
MGYHRATQAMTMNSPLPKKSLTVYGRPLMASRAGIAAMLVTLVVMAVGQIQHQTEVLSVDGYEGQANVIREQGRVFVDAQELAQITNGSLSVEKDRIVLTLPGRDGLDAEDAKSVFSRPFVKAAIEAMASIREWGGTLMATVQNGYPVTKTAAGYTINAYQGRAEDSIALAATAASTDADHRGLELLKNEFKNVQAWSDAFVRARSSLSAVDLTTSEDALRNDEDAQKLVHCGQFLAQMFAGGAFQDDIACH